MSLGHGLSAKLYFHTVQRHRMHKLSFVPISILH